MSKEVELQGIISTAWSRYSTTVPQCELIEASFKSLFMVGAILNGKSHQYDIIDEIIKKSLVNYNLLKNISSIEKQIKIFADSRRDLWDNCKFGIEQISIGVQPTKKYYEGLQKSLYKMTYSADELKKLLGDMVVKNNLEEYFDGRLKAVRAIICKITEPITKI